MFVVCVCVYLIEFYYCISQKHIYWYCTPKNIKIYNHNIFVQENSGAAELSDASQTYACQYCPSVFDTFIQLKSHRKQHTQQKVSITWDSVFFLNIFISIKWIKNKNNNKTFSTNMKCTYIYAPLHISIIDYGKIGWEKLKYSNEVIQQIGLEEEAINIWGSKTEKVILSIPPGKELQEKRVAKSKSHLQWVLLAHGTW